MFYEYSNCCFENIETVAKWNSILYGLVITKVYTYLHKPCLSLYDLSSPPDPSELMQPCNIDNFEIFTDDIKNCCVHVEDFCFLH